MQRAIRGDWVEWKPEIAPQATVMNMKLQIGVLEGCILLKFEYTEMLQTQLERGNNGLIKTKFLTFTIEAKDIKSARARL